MARTQWYTSRAVAILWLIMMSVLFVLPGSSLPKARWFQTIQIDKWIHVGLFFVLVFLWCSTLKVINKKGWVIVFIAIAYGFLVEIVQGAFIPNRSFDLYDLLADSAGAVGGLFISLKAIKK